MGWLPDRNSGAFWTLSCSCYQTRSSTSSCQISEYRKELNWITENSWNGSSMLRLLKRDIHGCTLTTGNRSWLLGYLDYEKLVILRYEITGSMSVSEERRTYPSPSPTTVNNQNHLVMVSPIHHVFRQRTQSANQTLSFLDGNWSSVSKQAYIAVLLNMKAFKIGITKVTKEVNIKEKCSI